MDGFRRASPAITKGANEVNKFNRNQQQATQETKRIQNGWDGIGDKVATAAALFGIVQAAQAVDTYVSNGARLGLLTDNLKEQAELQEKVYQAAQRSRGSYNAMVSVVAKLGLLAEDAFSSNNELVAFSELMQKSFAISGASTFEQEAGMYQLTQAMASGKLQGDEFRSIMENAPMLADAIAKFTGKSKGELKEMSAEGTITSDIIKASLFKAADDIEAKFEKMPRTFASTWTQIKNYTIKTFGGVMQTINNFLNSDTGAAMAAGVMGTINIIAAGISWLIDRISAVGSFIQQNWSIIQPILTQLAIAIGVTLVTAFVMWAASAISAGISAVMALSPVILTAFAIGTAIGFVILILNQMGISFDQVIGFIGGLLYGLYAAFYNIIAQLWNQWNEFAEFFANVFNHPVYSVKRLFVNLANDVLDTVKRIASAIDAVFGSNLSSSITGLQKKMDNWLGEMPEGYKVMQNMEYKSIAEYAGKGYDAGSGLINGITGKFSNVSSLFKGSALNSLGGMDAVTKNNLPNIGKVDEVGKIKQDVNIAEEDLQLMKDVAEMRYVQNFVTLTPTVAMEASISEKVDVKHVMDEIERVLVEQVASSAEGHYA